MLKRLGRIKYKVLRLAPYTAFFNLILLLSVAEFKIWYIFLLPIIYIIYILLMLKRLKNFLINCRVLLSR